MKSIINNTHSRRLLDAKTLYLLKLANGCLDNGVHYNFAASHMTVNGFMPAAKPSTPEQQALYNKKVKSLGLSTDIREAQWIQSAMGYNRDTTAFNYTQNATAIPSMQLDYSRFMDSVMTATQPTIKYPAYAASNPSSVQPTAQGVGTKSGGFLGSIENGLKKVGNYWHQMQDAYSQFAKANPYAADQLALSNPLAFALSGKAQAGVQNAGDIGVAFIDGGVRTVSATIVGVGKATAGVFTDPVGTYHKIDAWGNRLEAGANYLGDHPFKSAYAVYQLASAHLEKLSTQTATQNARELGGLVAGSAITAGIGKIAGSGLSFLSDLGKVAPRFAELDFLSTDLAMYGSGPTSGVISVFPEVSSVKALENYFPNGKVGSGIEYVYDPERNIFAVGKVNYASKMGIGGSPHQQLARAINANEESVLGGTFIREESGGIILTENSGHYGARWNSIPEAREKIINMLQDQLKVDVTFERWNSIREVVSNGF